MLNKIILASGNKGKIAEIQTMLEPLNIEVIPQNTLNVPEVAETGLSFVENAIIKARNACLYTQLPAIADDSGLEVDCLHGAPGIYSSRYSGDNATDSRNIEKLLQELKIKNISKPTAHFRCVMVFMRHAEDPTPLIATGSWDGYIIETPQGKNGFGYDPIFYVPSHNCTVAQLNSEIKNSLSHRSYALHQLMKMLKNHVN